MQVRIGVVGAVLLAGCQTPPAPSEARKVSARLEVIFEPIAADYEEFLPTSASGNEGDILISEPAPHAEPCDFDGVGPAPLLRPGCPATPPDVAACEVEGLECLYEGAEACLDEYVCQLGLWSFLESHCEELTPGLELTRTSPADAGVSCPESPPAPGLPCEPEEALCGYGECAAYDWQLQRVECKCGRWLVGGVGCPTVP